MLRDQKLKDFYEKCLNPSHFFLYIMEQTTDLELPIPNEIIEIVMAYLSFEDLLTLTAVGTERLKRCAFSALRKKLCGKI